MRACLAVLAALSSVPIVASPGFAATGSCSQPAAYSAVANADLLKVSVLNLRPLGLSLPPVADLSIASSSSLMSAQSAVRSKAASQYADAKLLGLRLPKGPLDGSLFQQAPPMNQKELRLNALTVDLGVARAGTGDLTAHATWNDAIGCGTSTGVVGESSAALVDAAVLPGSRGALVALPRNLASRTVTGTVVRGGFPASAAGAEAGLAQIDLLGGAVSVKVINPPRLQVLATGSRSTSSVDYSAPLLEISGPGIQTQRLGGLSKTIEIPVPTGGAGPLASLLGGLPLGELTSVTERLGGGLLSGDGLSGSLGELALLRLSIGELNQSITDQKVAANAASLRVQLLARNEAGNQSSAVLDLGVGLLSAEAAAPARADGPSTGPSGPGTPGPNTVPTGNNTLPLTGTNVGWIVAAGIGLYLLGRFLTIASRKRAGATTGK